MQQCDCSDLSYLSMLRAFPVVCRWADSVSARTAHICSNYKRHQCSHLSTRVGNHKRFTDSTLRPQASSQAGIMVSLRDWCGLLLSTSSISATDIGDEFTWPAEDYFTKPTVHRNANSAVRRSGALTQTASVSTQTSSLQWCCTSGYRTNQGLFSFELSLEGDFFFCNLLPFIIHSYAARALGNH